jgi:hypothetical protein
MSIYIYIFIYIDICIHIYIDKLAPQICILYSIHHVYIHNDAYMCICIYVYMNTGKVKDYSIDSGDVDDEFIEPLKIVGIREV